MPIVQQGSLNTTALVVPDLYVQIVPPTPVINGVPSNVVGTVGTASWGPTNRAVTVGNYAQYVQNFGPLINRKYDAGTGVAIAVQQGATSIVAVRASDGTDAAATSTGIAGCITFAGLYTGSLGNSITASLAAGSKANSWKLQVGLAGIGVVEAFDNITGGVANNTPTAGSGYTTVPTLAYSLPQLPGGIQAQGSASLTVVSATGSGGTGYAINDIYPFANGVTLKITGVSAGAVTTVSVHTGGNLTTGTAPTTGQTQTGVGSPGTGTGATFVLTWGIGPATVSVGGTGYTSATATLTGGGDQRCLYCRDFDLWQPRHSREQRHQRFARTIADHHGNWQHWHHRALGAEFYLQRRHGRRQRRIVQPRRRRRPEPNRPCALRNQGVSVGFVADLDDSTQWTTVDTFAQSEGVYMIQVAPAGIAISNGSTGTVDLKTTAGLDSWTSKLLHGDWIWWNDNSNGIIRLVSPQAFIAGRIANLSPEQSSLNKQIQAVVSSQKQGFSSNLNNTYSFADLQTLFTASIDVITNPVPGGGYWGARLGHNSSSDPTRSGDNYTRLTNYIAATLYKGMGLYVGQVINQQWFVNVRSTLLSYLGNLLQQGILGSLDGSLPYAVKCDLSNNPFARTSLGYGQADVTVQYQAINEKFIVNLAGGQTVQILLASQQVNSGSSGS